MKKLTFFLLSITCTIALAQTATPRAAPISAEDRFSENEFTRKLASKGIDPMDLPVNIGFREKLLKGRERIKAILGSSYAGQWLKFDEDGRAHHIVATTNPTLPKNINLDYDVRFVLVERSMDELEAIRDTIFNAYKNSTERDWEIYLFYIDEELNKVGVSGKEENKNKILEFLKKSRIDMEAVDFEVAYGPIVLYDNSASNKISTNNP